VTDRQLDDLTYMSDQWLNQILTEEERATMHYWSGSGYRTIRADFKKGNITDKVHEFRGALERAPRVAGRPLWRGIQEYGVEGHTVGADEAKERWERRKGTDIHWMAPGSATLNPEEGYTFAGNRGVVLEIYNADGRYINAASRFAGSDKDEYEAVIMPYSRFKVLDVFTGKYRTKFGERERTTVILNAIS